MHSSMCVQYNGDTGFLSCVSWLLKHFIVQSATGSLSTQHKPRHIWEGTSIEKLQCKSQKEWGTPGKQGPLIHMNKDHMNHRDRSEKHRPCAGSFANILWLPVLYFYVIPECENKWIFVSCGFSWALFLLFVHFI